MKQSPRRCEIQFVLLLSAGCTTGQVAPQGYSCGDPSKGHCYAQASVGDHLTGFQTTIGVVSTFLPGDGFVNNEFWLNNYRGSGGWIEIGYQANTVELPKYFWAKVDPDTHLYQSFDIGTIPSEEVSTRVTFDVHQTGEDTFVLSVDGTTTHFTATVTINLWDGTYGGYVMLGQELSGMSGAAASLAMFVDNQAYDQTYQRHFLTEADNPSDDLLDKPPYGGWFQKPAAGNQGGVFPTYCCKE